MVQVKSEAQQGRRRILNHDRRWLGFNPNRQAQVAVGGDGANGETRLQGMLQIGDRLQALSELSQAHRQLGRRPGVPELGGFERVQVRLWPLGPLT